MMAIATSTTPEASTRRRAEKVEEDFFPVIGFDHLELYCGNAKQSAAFYERCFGYRRIAYRGLETGDREKASHVLEQGKIHLVLTSALHPDHEIARHALQHGDGVKVIALRVPDAARAYEAATRRGAQGVLAPTEERDEQGVLRRAAVQAYGDTWMAFVERGGYEGAFAPGFVPVESSPDRSVGLLSIDHVVGNVELGRMNYWVEWFGRTMGFSQLLHFDDKQISTEYSALMSKVMQDGTGKVKFPINEPAQGKRKSQIEEYLEYYHGPGVQHVACTTRDIIRTVRELRDRGIDFLRVPTTYYDELERRVGKIDEPVDQLAELGILVDRDDDGYLLQIFTKPVQDRPTVFYEVIERHGARGFGEGNFKSLFEAIEREQAIRGNL
jgi:4-hydroxyphenylpyruvate dioxygenase